MLPENTEESEDAVADICLNLENDSELVFEKKSEFERKVIDKENINISDLSKFPEALWDYILEKEKLEATVKNVTIYCHTDQNYTENLRIYMESHISEIVNSLDGNTNYMDDWERMIVGMAYEENFDLDLFRKCYESITLEVDTIEITSVKENSKLDYLIDRKAFKLTDANYNNIKNKSNRYSKYYPHIKLLETWPEEYGNNIDRGKYQVKDYELPSYLRSKIPTQYKLSYIKRKIMANTGLNQDTILALADLIEKCGKGQTVDPLIYNKVLKSAFPDKGKKAAVVNAVIKANNMTEKTKREEILKTAGLGYLLNSDYPLNSSLEIRELWSLLHDNCENE